MRRLGGILAALVVASTASAEPVTLRMAAIAPDGTEWARALKAYARNVEAATHGELKIKWYLGGIAGDELTALDRIRRGQLDGEGGAIFCQRLAPSLRAARVPGLYNTKEELIYVLGRLKPTLDEEFKKSGFTSLGVGLFGSDVLFSRQPINSMKQLMATRIWAWSLDPVWQQAATEMGFHTIVSNLEEHSPEWRRKQYDAFFAVPSAALAYQWSTETNFYSELPATMLPACLVIANTAIDPLPTELRQALVAESAKFMIRFNEISIQLENSLVAGGLFEKQGMVRVPVSAELKSQFVAAARQAVTRLGAALIAPSLLASVDKMLTEYRAAHRAQADNR